MLTCPHCNQPIDALPNLIPSFCPHCGGDIRGLQAAPDEPPAPEQPAAEPATQVLPTAAPVVPPEQPTLEQPPVVPTSEQPAPEQPAQEASKNPKKKRILAIVIAIVAVAAIVGGIFGYQAYNRSASYAKAQTMMEEGDYAGALDIFNRLGTYEDSAAYAEYCSNMVAFETAEDLVAAGDYEAAKEAFEALGVFNGADTMVPVCDAWIAFEQAEALTEEGKFAEADALLSSFNNVDQVTSSERYQEWLRNNQYGLAKQWLADGKYYDAYVAFGKLNGYADSATLQQQCVQPLPGNTELYHNPDYNGGSVRMTFDGSGVNAPNYLKVYCGNVLVSTVFINVGGSVTINLPADTYTFKRSSGDQWFGEDGMFGDEGHYRILTFDGGAESYYLEAYGSYTLTLEYSGDDGNVDNQTVDADSF